jgi:hypothetical protein
VHALATDAVGELLGGLEDDDVDAGRRQRVGECRTRDAATDHHN